MNVLLYIHGYPPFHNAGAEYMAKDIAEHLAAKGESVIVFSPRTKDTTINGVRIIPNNYQGYHATHITTLVEWADVVITHLDMTGEAYNATVNRPLVHLVHNSARINLMERATPQFAAYNSEWLKETHEAKYNYRSTGTVIRPIIDPDKYRVDNSGAEAITLINCNKNKGGEIFAQLAKAMPDQKFIAVGGNYGMQHMGWPKNVEHIPNTSKIKSVYKRTRILFMGSIYESWGRTAGEAMSSGIPVVCTPTPGLKEQCGDAARFIDMMDRAHVPAWIAAIKDVNDNYTQWSTRARARAHELWEGNDYERFRLYLSELVSLESKPKPVIDMGDVKVKILKTTVGTKQEGMLTVGRVVSMTAERAKQFIEYGRARLVEDPKERETKARETVTEAPKEKAKIEKHEKPKDSGRSTNTRTKGKGNKPARKRTTKRK